MQLTLKKSFLKACFEISGIFFWLALLLSVISFANNILILIMLFKIFNYQQLNMGLMIGILLGLMANRLLLGYLQLITERKIRRKFCSQINSYFDSASWESKNKVFLSTLISRDILLLLDTIPTISKLFYFPICFVLGISAIYKLIGINGVIATLTVIAFIPLSMFIAGKCISLANEIYNLSKLRLSEVSKWIEWRSMIVNWSETSGPLNRISKLTDKELGARTLDSFWRSLDLYIITFGRCLPVAILIIISIIYKNDISNQLLLTLWLSVPFIGLIMEAGRFTTDFQLGKKAFSELSLNYNPLADNYLNELVLNDSWEIWDGTLAQNCLADESNIHLALTTKLRLDQELNKVHHSQLIRFGKNISEGQKARILIIRAIHIAVKHGVKIRIDRTLNSLDPDACIRLSSILKEPEISQKISLSESAKIFLDHQLGRAATSTENFMTSGDGKPKPTTANSIAPSNSLFKDLTRFLTPLSLLFLLPAISLSYIGFIAIAKIDLTFKLVVVLSASIFSVMLVVFLGMKNESQTRAWAKTKMIDILEKAQLKNTTDIYQRLSRDFSTVVERISWYLHDITWLVSLLVVSVIATVYSFGTVGVVIGSIFLTLGFGIWKIFESRINCARAMSVETLNQMLIMGENLACYGVLANYTDIKLSRKVMIQTTVNNLYRANNRLISLKIIFSNLILAASGLFILATLVSSTYSWISPESLVFILTAILAVDASLGIMFQALSGFSAQRISIHRLSDFNIKSNNQSIKCIEKKGQEYIFKGAVNVITGSRYTPLTFGAGMAYSIVGASGIGKTQFLKLISGLSNDVTAKNSTSILYINQDANKIESWLKNSTTDATTWTPSSFTNFVENKILNENFHVVVIDEALIAFDINTAENIINQFQAFVSQTGGLLLLVDHRFNLANSISISEVQSSTKVINR